MARFILSHDYKQRESKIKPKDSQKLNQKRVKI